MQPLLHPEPRRKGFERAAQPARQHRAHLVEARLQELGHAHGLVGLGADLVAHLGEALGPGLEIGDADHVLVGHPQREMARAAAVSAPSPRSSAAMRAGAVEIEPRIGDVLVIDEAADAFLDDRHGGGGKSGADAGDEAVDRRRPARRACGRRAAGASARHARRAQPPAGGEGGEIGLDRDPRRADRRLEMRAPDRAARPRDAATPSSTALSESAARLRLARQVEQDRAARQRARGGEDAAHVEPAVRHRRFSTMA